MHPKVSIVTSTYNGEQYLKESVGSMLGQTFEDFEFIIVDDGSTDNTLEKLQQMDDPRIRIFQQSNQGQTNALIAGVEQAQGELIARIDQDDYSLSHRLIRQVEFMDAHPGVNLCGSRFQELYDDDLDPQRVQFAQTDTEIRKVISCFNPLAHSAVVFRRDAYMKVGGYDKSFSIGMDYDLFIRLMEIGQVHNLEEVLTVIRMHGESHSMKKIRLKTVEGIKIRCRAYTKFGGDPFLAGFFFLKSITSLVLPSWLKTRIPHI
jgi:glycosyltransferase involved in cell wall biosynthesis